MCDRNIIQAKSSQRMLTSGFHVFCVPSHLCHVKLTRKHWIYKDGMSLTFHVFWDTCRWTIAMFFQIGPSHVWLQHTTEILTRDVDLKNPRLLCSVAHVPYYTDTCTLHIQRWHVEEFSCFLRRMSMNHCNVLPDSFITWEVTIYERNPHRECWSQDSTSPVFLLTCGMLYSRLHIAYTKKPCMKLGRHIYIYIQEHTEYGGSVRPLMAQYDALWPIVLPRGPCTTLSHRLLSITWVSIGGPEGWGGPSAS